MMKSEVSQRATKILMLELLRLAILSWACITSVPNTNTATALCGGDRHLVDNSYSLLVSPKVRLSFQEALLMRERNSVADTMARSSAEGRGGSRDKTKWL